jgi:GNAT superfamily N-acetyltransferase
MGQIDIVTLTPGAPELAVCARWRAENFSVLATDLAREKRSLDSFVADRSHQIALVAKRGDIAAGTCLLVPSEIEPVHSVSPWLAGLYVAPEHRRCGVGEALVRAIAQEARIRNHRRLFLYTSEAAGFYRRLGWTIIDRASWKGFDTALMAFDL